MVRDTTQPTQGQSCCSFMTLVFSLAGWALFEAWAVIMGATWVGHVLIAVPGLILTVLSLPRSSTGDLDPAGDKKGLLKGSRWVLAPPVFLFLLGAVLGLLILMGFMVLLGLVVACLSFAPWSRLAFSRQHFALCCSATLTGLIFPIAVGHRSVDLMFLPLACWVFWLCACCALLVQAEKRYRVERKAKAGYGAVETKSDPVTVRT